MVNALIDKLSRRDGLSPAEQAVLREVLGPPRAVASGQDLVRQHSTPAHSTVLLDGFSARYTALADGRRQITEINVRGDFVDLHSFLMRPMDHGVMTLTACAVSQVSHRALKRLTENHPHLARLLWLDTLIDAAIHRRWMVGMGRMSGLGRFSHLLCELYLRLEVVGAAARGAFDLPLTQTELGDALGLSPIHVNRLLGEMRREGLVAWRGSRVRLLDWNRLAMIAQFDPAYLRLNREPV